MEIKNKRGRLTIYGLSCGYQELTEQGENRKRMYMEHGVIHVISFINNKRSWDSFELIEPARKYFDSIKL